MFEHTPVWRLDWGMERLASRLDRKSLRRLPKTRKGQRALYAAYSVGMFGSRRRRWVMNRAGEFGPLAEEMGKEMASNAGQVRKRRQKAQAA